MRAAAATAPHALQIGHQLGYHGLGLGALTKQVLGFQPPKDRKVCLRSCLVLLTVGIGVTGSPSKQALGIPGRTGLDQSHDLRTASLRLCLAALLSRPAQHLLSTACPPTNRRASAPPPAAIHPCSLERCRSP